MTSLFQSALSLLPVVFSSTSPAPWLLCPITMRNVLIRSQDTFISWDSVGSEINIFFVSFQKTILFLSPLVLLNTTNDRISYQRSGSLKKIVPLVQAYQSAKCFNNLTAPSGKICQRVLLRWGIHESVFRKKDKRCFFFPSLVNDYNCKSGGSNCHSTHLKA